MVVNEILSNRRILSSSGHGVLSEEDISRLLAQLTLNLLRIDMQVLPYIVDCLLNSGLFFTDLGAVYYIEFGVSLKHVYVDECLPFSQHR